MRSNGRTKISRCVLDRSSASGQQRLREVVEGLVRGRRPERPCHHDPVPKPHGFPPTACAEFVAEHRTRAVGRETLDVQNDHLDGIGREIAQNTSEAPEFLQGRGTPKREYEHDRSVEIRRVQVLLASHDPQTLDRKRTVFLQNRLEVDLRAQGSDPSRRELFNRASRGDDGAPPGGAASRASSHVSTRGTAIENAGLDQKIGRENLHRHIDEALAHARQIVSG